MKKHLANILSSIRIVAGAFLYLFSDITGGFIILYIICGITDLLDGPIARKTGSTSSLGAILDTVGDAITYMAFVKILLVQHLVPRFIVIWMLGVLGLHLICGFVSLIRVKKFFIVHSLFGKLLGGSVFVMPFAMGIVKLLTDSQDTYLFVVHILMAIIAGFATIGGIESLAIQCKEDDPQTEKKTIISLFKKEKAN